MVRAAVKSFVLGVMASSFIAHGAMMAAMPAMTDAAAAASCPSGAGGAMPGHHAGTPSPAPHQSHGCCAFCCCQIASRWDLAAPPKLVLVVAPARVIVVVPAAAGPAPHVAEPFILPRALAPPLLA
jgi:hypothetical protein